MQIQCPHCGARSIAEFRFRSACPEADASGFAALYERVNRIERSEEFWQHVQGCRAWLRVIRNPSTAVVEGVRLLAVTV